MSVRCSEASIMFENMMKGRKKAKGRGWLSTIR
jgi:hypothetical protein